MKNINIFKIKDIYFASWENPPNLNDYFKCFRTSKDRKDVINHNEAKLPFEFVGKMKVENMKNAQEKIEMIYYSDKEFEYESLKDAIIEIKYLKKENEKLKAQLKSKMDKVAERNKRYYEKNKEKIKCDCGSNITKPNYSIHLKSNKHQKWVKENS